MTPRFVLLLKLSLVFLVGITCVFGKTFRMLDVVNRLKTTKVAESNSNSLEYVVYNYTQTLDHFNFKPHSYMTFQQRYVVLDKYWGGYAFYSLQFSLHGLMLFCCILRYVCVLNLFIHVVYILFIDDAYKLSPVNRHVKRHSSRQTDELASDVRPQD